MPSNDCTDVLKLVDFSKDNGLVAELNEEVQRKALELAASAARREAEKEQMLAETAATHAIWEHR